MRAARSHLWLARPPLDLGDALLLLERPIHGSAQRQQLVGRRPVEEAADQAEAGIVGNRDAPLPDLTANRLIQNADGGPVPAAACGRPEAPAVVFLDRFAP